MFIWQRLLFLHLTITQTLALARQRKQRARRLENHAFSKLSFWEIAVPHWSNSSVYLLEHAFFIEVSFVFDISSIRAQKAIDVPDCSRFCLQNPK